MGGVEDRSKWEAEHRIARSAEGHAVGLDLSGLALTTLPEWVGQLTHLTRLDLFGNRLSVLPESIGQLTHLTRLDLYGNALSALPESIGQLTRLTRLNLGGNGLSVLPEWVGQLTGLTRLDLRGNELSVLPESIGQLVNLTGLDLGGNELSVLPESIGQLVNLTQLDLGGNGLSVLPESIGQLTHLTQLDLAGNRLTYPPPAVIADGTEAVLSFLRAGRESGAERQWRSKLLIVGEGGAGKTTLLKVLLGEDPNPHEESTHGLDIRELPLPHPQRPGAVMRLSGWDFGGQHIYHATHQFFLTDQALFLLVWDSRAGWEHAKVRYWLDIIAARTGTGPNGSAAPVILVATRTQQRAPDLPATELRRDYPNIFAVLEVDSLADADNGIDRLRDHIARAAAELPLMGAAWPVSWLAAQQAVRQAEYRHMSWDHFQGLLSSAGIADSGERWAVTGSLHQLGEILHYAQDEELADIVVLKPAWLSERIAAILDCRPVADRHGLLTAGDIAREWADLGTDLRAKVLSMMDRYDVSYRIIDSADDARAIVVDRVPWEPPDYQAHWQALAPPNGRELRLHYILSGTVPPGIPGWFIARAHRFATTGHRPWRTGVLLADPDQRHLGLLRLDRAGNTVQLTVRGPHPAGFFGTLDLDFTQAILRRYPGLPVVRAVPCPEPAGCTSSWPYDQLLERERLGRSTVECGTSLRDIPITSLLDGIGPAQPAGSDPASLAAAVTRLEAALARISGQIDLAGAAQREQAELAHLQFSQLMSWTRTPSPTVLTLTEKAPRIPGLHRYRLRLYCAEPNAIHQLPDDRGCYDVTILDDNIGAFARRLHLVIGLLSSVTGLTGSALGIAAPELLARNKDDLAKAKHALEAMSKATGTIAGQRFQRDLPVGGTPTEADSRVIAHLLEPLRAKDNWGGLIKTVTPGGLTLYLCEDHYRAYNAPSPRPLDL